MDFNSFINDTIGFRSVKQYSFTADEFGVRYQNAGEAHSIMSPKSQEERNKNVAAMERDLQQVPCG